MAITVVLAATIYVWVSGFGGGGSKTPALSVSVDNVNDKFMITDVDSGVNWTDLSIKITTDGTAANLSIGTTYYTQLNTFNAVTYSADMHAGDEIVVESTTGANYVTIVLRYDPTDSILGTWTVYI